MAAAIKRGIKEYLWISVQNGIETGRGSFPPEVTPTFPAAAGGAGPSGGDGDQNGEDDDAVAAAERLLAAWLAFPTGL